MEGAGTPDELPKEVPGSCCGLLTRFTDFIGRSVEYQYSDDRELLRVLLPEVTNSNDEYASEFSSGDPERGAR